MPKIELLDGAMGSEFIKRGINLPEGIWSADVNINYPNIVKEIHEEYIEAGAHYITTNTFRTTPRAYMKTGLNNQEASLLSKKSFIEAVNASKKASNRTSNILGSVTTLEDCYRPDLFPGRKTAQNEYKYIAKWFDNDNIDIILIETMNSITEAEACIDQFSYINKPIWVSFILKDQNHILSGETLLNAIEMLNNYNIDVLLINCSPMYATNYCMKTIPKNWKKRWGIYPNFGIGKTSSDGNINLIHSNDSFIRLCYNAIDLGASLLGGCCGSNPSHIKLLSRFL